MEARELELEKLRDGLLKAAKKTQSTVETKREAFDKYIRMFYDLRKIEVSYTLSCAFNHVQLIKPSRTKCEGGFKQ